MKLAPAKLFHAVVITGAALTGCAGTGKRPTTTANETTTSSTKAPRPTEASRDDVCPPGSELPYPPCFLIL